MKVEEEFVPFDIMDREKNRTIKNILNIVDMTFDVEERTSRKRDKIRKVVMDEINELYRCFVIERENAKKRNTI